MGIWSSIKSGFKSVGKFVKNNWKLIAGAVAAVAIPFVGPWIGGALAGSAFLAGSGVGAFLGSAAGGALISAGLGAGAAALTGQNPLLGAALGGIGGFGVGLANGASMFGGLAGTSASVAAPAAATSTTASGLGNVGIGGAGLEAASTSAGAISQLGDSLAKGITPGNLAKLALTMFNKRPEELNTAEKERLQFAAQQAASNRALFEQQVARSQQLWQANQPNPEQAYAGAQQTVQRGVNEIMAGQTPGLQEATARKAAIAGATAGSVAVAQDWNAKSNALMGVNTMFPSGAPEDPYTAEALKQAKEQAEWDQRNREQVAGIFGGMSGSL